MSIEVNLTIKQGADYRFKIVLKDKAGVPIDLTYKTFSGQARESYKSDEVAFSFNFTKADQEESPGEVMAHVPNDALEGVALFDRTNYVYDIEMVNDEPDPPEEGQPPFDNGVIGDVTAIAFGRVTVIPEVTRS